MPHICRATILLQSTFTGKQASSHNFYDFPNFPLLRDHNRVTGFKGESNRVKSLFSHAMDK